MWLSLGKELILMTDNESNRNATDTPKKDYKIIKLGGFIALIVIYILFCFFWRFWQNYIFREGYGVPCFISSLLIYLWYFWLKDKSKEGFTTENTGFSSEEDVDEFVKKNNCLLGSYFVTNSIIWGIAAYVIPTYFSDINIINFTYFGFLISMLLFAIFLILFLPSRRAILKHDEKVIDKFAYLNLWNYYLFKEEKISNYSLFFKNTSGITNKEINLVLTGLKNERKEQLDIYKLYSEIPKFRDSAELSFGLIINKIIKVTGSVGLLGVLYKIGMYIFTNIQSGDDKNTSTQQFLLNSGATIVLIFFVIVFIWFISSILFFELSSSRKRKQVDYLFPKLLDEAIRSSGPSSNSSSMVNPKKTLALKTRRFHNFFEALMNRLH